MNKIFLSSLCLVFAAALASPIPSQAHNNSKLIELTDTIITIITEISYIDDEYEPEAILTLGNDLHLLIKCYNGIFFEGQSVGVRFDEGKFMLDLITFDQEGIETGQMSFYRVCESNHFYQSL